MLRAIIVKSENGINIPKAKNNVAITFLNSVKALSDNAKT
jgi:hypothetical protein